MFATQLGFPLSRIESRRPLWTLFCSALCLAALIAAPLHAADPAPEKPTDETPKFDEASLEFFESKVRPLLVSRCYECHGPDKPVRGGLRMDSRAAILAGGETGPAAVAGKPKESLLVDAINYGDVYQMPPKSKLPAAEIAVFTRWVEMGLPWPPSAATTGVKKNKIDIPAQKKAHWAWKPLTRPNVPEVKDREWPTADLDRFILAALESRQLHPAKAADRRTLIRRLSFDLTGLPPTADEIQAFLADNSPQAIERVVDRLLDSPHFGERWARHWLDLVRFAETRGHEFEPIIPNAWQYRDYLIRALNADVPYDQFVTEHLAGDLMSPPRLNPKTGANESVLGTGFWFLGEEVHSPVDIRQDETDRLDNRLDVMTKTFLGLTVGCARCHDHKFDPIPQDDYYAMIGFLLSASYRQAPFESMEQNRRVAAELQASRDTARRDVVGALLRDAAPHVARAADYLQAAHAVLPLGVKLGAPPQRLPDDLRARLDEHARERKLDPEILAAWAVQLAESVEIVDHPLHLLGQLGPDRQNESREQFAERWKTMQQRRLKPVETQDGQRVIVDYATATPAEWMPDGVAFGTRAARPGDVEFSDNPEQPIAEFITYFGARRDPFWNGLKLSGTTERDHGGLGGWERPGRTLRTPTITLDQGRVYFLVRGGGRSYAVVDSHLVVAGPLHGRVLREWDAPADRWQWVEHDLTPYRGHRVHLEFSPKTPDGPLAIARVVEAERAPPAPPAPIAWARQAVNGLEAGSWQDVAQRYQAQLNRAIETMTRETKMPTAPQSREEVDATIASAQAVQWLLSWHPGLTRLARDSAAGKAAAKFVEQRQALVPQARFESATAPAMYEGSAANERLLIRGSPKTPGPETPRRFLAALSGAAAEGYGPGSGRLVLARQILADDNPFTARVAVNRVWHHLFGRGLVPTVDNFGVLGQAPTHPELLDWLADNFRREQHWSLKQLLKSIVLSKTYQMASAADPAAVQADPQNLLWHHMPIRRLQAESIRDAILATSGRLDRTVLGPPVEVHLTPFMDGRGRPGGSGPLDGAGRRSIYTKVRRNFLSPMMLAFDMPIPFNTMGKRSVSNVPAQALILMNDPFVIEQAKVWAKRMLSQPQSPTVRIEQMYLTAFGRLPTEAELKEAESFLDVQGERYGVPPAARAEHPEVWADLAHVLFNTKEFIFLR